MVKNKSIYFVSFLQALGLVLYISLVSVIFWRGNVWFGNMNNYLGPLLMLTLFAVSALVCALITLSYPFMLWQKQKKPKKAIKLISYTVLWTLSFVLLGLSFAAIF